MRTQFFSVGRWSLVVAVLVLVSATTSVGAASAAWTKVAIWEMNEGSTATVMRDSSGKGRTGVIGNTVITGVPSDTSKAYQWPPDPALLDIERLVVVDRPAMNPLRDGFTVKLRMKTSATQGNILQKGQATTSGGMWKIELTDGRIFCTFKGSARRVATGSRQVLSDNKWHTVQCTRRRTGVTIVVDSGIPRTENGWTGMIDNNRPLTIGGKWTCNGTTVSCQYYVGLLDRVALRRRT